MEKVGISAVELSTDELRTFELLTFILIANLDLIFIKPLLSS
jgi:hypothetical protein